VGGDPWQAKEAGLRTLYVFPWMLWRLLRNGIRFAPKARHARREVLALLAENGFPALRAWHQFHLGDARDLVLIVMFHTDADLEKFRSSGLAPAVTDRFRESLRLRRYPLGAIADVQVSFDSEEELNRLGYYNWSH
jgi:hypothetical protein